MRNVYVCFLLITVFISTNINCVKASNLEKGNPTAIYAWDTITLPDNRALELKENYTILFINGTLVTDFNVIIKDGRSLVPVRFISEELGASVYWDEIKKEVTIKKSEKNIILTINKDTALVNDKEIALDCPATLYEDSTYVPLRFIAENLDCTVNYAPRQQVSEYTYYYDTTMPISPDNTIIRDFPNIIIDEKYDLSNVITKDEAMQITQEVCMMGLENFKKSTVEYLLKSGELPDRFNSEIKSIETEINKMLYIGEVSRYYKFTIGPYDILFDKFNHKLFFQIYSSGIIVKEVDINDSGLFMPVFIIG